MYRWTCTKRGTLWILPSRKARKSTPPKFSVRLPAVFKWRRTLASKADKSKIVTNARQTTQFAEDARALSAERQEAERIQKEKDAAAAAAKGKAEEQAAVEAKRQAELTAAKEAQMNAE